MNYSDLTSNIEDICVQTFTADQLAMFTQQAEQNIYNTVDLPVFRETSLGSMTAGNSNFTLPASVLYIYSFAVINDSGGYEYLLNKDVNFIREAYPNPTSQGQPAHYALEDETKLLLGPTPDANYSTQLVYAAYPESIVTAGTTWLGDEFDSALLNGALVEAIRFQKGDPDMVALYQKMYVDAIALLKNLGDGKLRGDMYRSGQLRVKVR